jgi:hypothetical protein
MTTQELNRKLKEGQFYGIYCSGETERAAEPILDDVTQVVAAALRHAALTHGNHTRGMHSVPGDNIHSSPHDYGFVYTLPETGNQTVIWLNSLAVYYTAFYRHEFDPMDWAVVNIFRSLPLVLQEVSEDELFGREIRHVPMIQADPDAWE